MQNTKLATCLMVCVLGLTGTAAHAAAEVAPTKAAMPAADSMEYSSIEYITGGVGDEERAAIESEREAYNVHVLNAAEDGSYISDAMLTIADRRGRILLTANAGPLFYAQLPAGTYTITVTSEGRSQHKMLRSNRKTNHDIRFVW